MEREDRKTTDIYSRSSNMSFMASLMTQWVKSLPSVQEMRQQEIQVHLLGREDPLEEEMATHSSILA